MSNLRFSDKNYFPTVVVLMMTEKLLEYLGLNAIKLPFDIICFIIGFTSKIRCATFYKKILH